MIYDTILLNIPEELGHDFFFMYFWRTIVISLMHSFFCVNIFNPRANNEIWVAIPCRGEYLWRLIFRPLNYTFKFFSTEIADRNFLDCLSYCKRAYLYNQSSILFVNFLPHIGQSLIPFYYWEYQNFKVLNLFLIWGFKVLFSMLLFRYMEERDFISAF